MTQIDLQRIAVFVALLIGMPFPAGAPAQPADEPVPEPLRQQSESWYHWQYISYPALESPYGTGRMQVKLGLGDKENGLRLHLSGDASQEAFEHGMVVLPKEGELTARLHKPDGKVIQADKSLMVGVWTGKMGSMVFNLECRFPWQENELEEAWIELRMPERAYWIEVPYGFTRNPADPPAPARPDGGLPKFAPAMKYLPANDRLVYLEGVHYDLLKDSLLSVTMANPFDGRVRVRLDSKDVFAPRTRLAIQEPSGERLESQLVGLWADEHGSRYDLYFLKRSDGEMRAWGRLMVELDGTAYSIFVPSSLYRRRHGRVDYHQEITSTPRVSNRPFWLFQY